MNKKTIINMIKDSINEGVHVVDENGNTLVYNNTMEELEGLKSEEVVNKNFLEMLNLRGKSTINEVLRTGNPIINKYQTYFNKNGKEISTLNSTWPIRKDGEIIGAIEVSKDITKIKKLSEKIYKMQEYDIEKISKGKKNRDIYCFDDIIGQSSQIKDAKDIAIKASKTDSNVMIIGESGTGKELFAQSMHNASDRRDKPFIAENCAAIPETLLESLLFGTIKGGFTGAVDRPGLFQQADGGTLMLDEINSMPLELQAKLLRVIQTGKFRKIGGSKEIKTDVRLISTINENPRKAIATKKLRKDLFYRLSVVNLFIPPLRERGKDIRILTNYFIDKLSYKIGKNIKGVDDKIRKVFDQYTWPGNVRELEHGLEGAINLIENNSKIGIEDLPYNLKVNISMYTEDEGEKKNNLEDTIELPDVKKSKINLSEYLKSIEKTLIKRALEESEGNITLAARTLGITRQGLQYKLKNKLFK